MAEQFPPALWAKDVFTTGEAAELCRVSQQTIIRCFDAGRLRGFRVPGSRFRRIPRDELVRFMQESGIPTDAVPEATARHRVLVVDDDPAIVELLEDVLASDGRFEVETACNGYEAGLATARFQPQLILLDYMLPDLNGSDVCRAIRSNPDLAGTRILFVSGAVNPDEVKLLMEAGADGFVHKPFEIDDLLAQIHRLLAAPRS